MVEFKEECHAVAVALKLLFAVGGINGGIEFLVSLDEFVRHGQRIIQIGKRRFRVLGTSI
ncbi:MAG: hypothetical protein EOM37_00800 [Proteobacteria bacterium]|nr:hypothetical protein [Pseudomonadota bacterium]